MRIPILATVTVTVAISAAAAQAQDKPTDEARVAFLEGVEHYKAGHTDAALGAFHRAHKLNPSWKIQYNIGQCEAALKRYGLAIEAFEKYLAGGGDEITVERRDKVLAELDRLRKMTGSVAVEAPAGAVVIVDGIERGRTPLPGHLRVIAGVDHEVVLKKGDTVISRRVVRVGGGETIALEIGEEEGPPQPLPGQQPEPDEDASSTPQIEVDRGDGLPILFWIGAGLTVATFSTGIGFGAASNSRFDDFEADAKKVGLGTLPPDDAGLLEARDDVKTYEKVATAMFVTGGVLAAATAAVLVVHFTKGEDENSATAAVAAVPGGIAVSF